MRLKQKILAQFKNPSGSLGQLVGILMAVKNTARSRWTLEKLQVAPDDHILEIGYGPGVTLAGTASRLSKNGSITGIDLVLGT